jgi:hypothetical protein
MAGPNPFILSQRFSQLINRKVTFVQTTMTLDMKIKQIYGIYTLSSIESAIVVKADLILLASIAGALVGLPDSAVKERLKTVGIDDLLNDAISEVFNVASAAVSSEGRAVFSKFVTDSVFVDGVAGKVFKEPFHRSYFTVAVEGYQGGRMSIFSPFIPIKLGPR